MEKLLHERLRESTDNDGFCKKYTLANGKPLRIYEREAFDLADEIERYYIPRPRFEDGTPVQFGDEVRAENVTYKVNEIALSESNWFLRQSQAQILGGSIGSPVYRPNPRVLDADGVEIKVGDTVWSSMYGDNSFTVERISKNPNGKPIVMVEEMGSGLFPATCYHERPVFDVEGVRIHNGDTVWRVEDGIKMRVIGIGDEALAESCEVLTEIDGKQPFHYNGKELTHREPDSLEKLLKDMEDNPSGFLLGANASLAKDWKSRLTALMERDA